MNTEELYILWIDYISNNISQPDYHKLMDAITNAKNDPELYAIMEKIWDSHPIEQSFSDFQSEVLYQKMITDSRFTSQIPPVIPLKTKKLFYKRTSFRLLAAAAILIVICVGVLQFVHNDPHADVSSPHLVATNIAPGGNKAMLILENGTKVSLTDLKNGETFEDNGVKIKKTVDGQLVYDASAGAALNQNAENSVAYHTIVTPVGGQYEVILPDGTNVWLNASSSLKFPVNFTSATSRNVTLTGEGYFEVMHNEHKPFIVNSDNQLVKVLGTHFNINTYTDEPQTITTLFEGSVEVTKLNSKNEDRKIIKPGQQAMVSLNKIEVADANLDAALAWKNGYFNFNNEELSSVMRKIARWYDVEVVISEGVQTARTLEGATPRSKDLSEILRKFELLGNIHFKIEGRRVTVMP